MIISQLSAIQSTTQSPFQSQVVFSAYCSCSDLNASCQSAVFLAPSLTLRKCTLTTSYQVDPIDWWGMTVVTLFLITIYQYDWSAGAESTLVLRYNWNFWLTGNLWQKNRVNRVSFICHEQSRISLKWRWSVRFTPFSYSTLGQFIQEIVHSFAFK